VDKINAPNSSPGHEKEQDEPNELPIPTDEFNPQETADLVHPLVSKEVRFQMLC
jgi:hypothetical protein